MASADPGFAVMPIAEDPKAGGLDKGSDTSDEAPVAPDQFDPKYETTRWEIWAYYAYYIGNNGLTLFNFAPTAFQNLLSEAAGDAGTLRFAGVNRTINSIVLVSNGISFAIQIVLFLIIGSYAGMQLVSYEGWTFPLTNDRFWPFAPQYPNSFLNCRIRDGLCMDGRTYCEQMARRRRALYHRLYVYRELAGVVPSLHLK